MLKLLMLPLTIAVMSLKGTLAVVKAILKYRVGKVVFVASLITAGIQHYGYRMSYALETSILLLVGVVAVVAIIAPRLRSWWSRRREKYKMDEKKRKWEKENYE